jgi:hypothetical protein
MPLSSVIGSSSIMQPGVCTSSTRPASPYDGQVIYETDTDKTLVWNGTGWVFLSTSRANPGGLDLVSSGSFTLQTTVSLPTGTFTSTYRNYKVIFDVTSTTSRSALTLRFRTAGTDNTANRYMQAAVGYDSESGTANLAQPSATSLTVATNYATEPVVINLDIFNPQQTLRTWGTGFYTSDSSSGAAVQTRATSFKHGDTTSFDSMTLISSVASSMTGIYRVYGMVD